MARVSSVPSGSRTTSGSGQSPPGQAGNPGEDYDIPLLKEERARREKVVSMLASSRSKRLSDASSEGSRPHSTASSAYSADASSISLSSSHSGSKLAMPMVDEASLQSSIDHEFELIDQLVENVAAQNMLKSKKASIPKSESIGSISSSTASENLLRSSKSVQSVTGSLDGEGSSIGGSNDNLGVWDDISSEEEDSDEAGGEWLFNG